MRLYLSIFICFFVLSCAKSPEEKLDSVKQEALFYLTEGNCVKARESLDEVSFQDDDADYVAIYSSTYACEAGYSELSSVFGNLEGLDSNSIIGSLAAFDTSNETQADSEQFLNLMSAIDTILSSTSTVGTTERTSKFGAIKATDLSMQALYMILIAMGKYFAYYGNADENGLKGQGSATNVCIRDYVNNAVDLALQSTPVNGCNSGNAGSDDLGSTQTAQVLARRSCYGIILFNNLFDILSNITLSSNSSLGDIANIQDQLTLLFDAAVTAESNIFGTASVADLRNILSQSTCEAYDDNGIQRYFVLLFETNFTNTP